MKKVSFLLLGMVCITMVSMAGMKPFEGVITYKISYPDSKFTESQMGMFPKVLTVSISGEKSKSEIVTAMGNQVEITDYALQTKVALLDIMGQKYAIKSNFEEIRKELESGPKAKVQVTSETKMIAGYNCKKALVTVDDKGTKYTLDVYYTSELGPKKANFDNPIYNEIDGVLMEFTMKTEQVTMKFAATSVEKRSISPKEYEIPSEYTVTTKEDLKSKFGGM